MHAYTDKSSFFLFIPLKNYIKNSFRNEKNKINILNHKLTLKMTMILKEPIKEIGMVNSIYAKYIKV